MTYPEIGSCAGLVAAVDSLGILPLLPVPGLPGWSADEMALPECRYARLPGGGWEWPLWSWKGGAVRESGCAYGKFLAGRAAFVSREWWPVFCCWRRAAFPAPAEGSVERMVLDALRECGSLTTRELRTACGFTGPGMRAKFDTLVTRLEMGCRIVTEDFVYPRDARGRDYGWGRSLLTTPEALFGRDACRPPCAPAEARSLLLGRLAALLPGARPARLARLAG